MNIQQKVINSEGEEVNIVRYDFWICLQGTWSFIISVQSRKLANFLFHSYRSTYGSENVRMYERLLRKPKK